MARRGRFGELTVDANGDGSKPSCESCADGVKDGVDTDIDGGTVTDSSSGG